MEDRLTPRLLLVRTGLDEVDAVRDRLSVVESIVGVTAWRNANPGRTDLPRTLEERDALVVAELTSDAEPPEPPDGASWLLFDRYPRPAQGRLTGRPTLGLLVVLISPPSEAEAQALRDWGDFVHLRHIAEAAVPGYTTITPYARVGDAGPRFLHFYEMDTSDPEAAFRSMTPLVAERLGGTDSDAYRDWATTPELRIDYVNTFARLDAPT